MTDAGPYTPVIPAPPAPPKAPQQPTQHTQQVQQRQQVIHVNWSHFKPEFSGKPEEDAEAHLLQTNNWMNACHFLEGIKIIWFCLKLL